jgi:hypothetical protein
MIVKDASSQFFRRRGCLKTMLVGFVAWSTAVSTTKEKAMKTFDLIVTLPEGTEHSDDLVAALFEAGCDDGSVWSTAGIVQIGFSRQAESLEAAIRSVIADVQKAGSRVVQVTLEEPALAALTDTA